MFGQRNSELSAKPRTPARPRGSVLFAFVAILVASGLWASSYAGDPAPGNGAKGAASAIDRGKYLVTVCGCNDCHTPLKMGPKGPEPDMSKMLSGHPQDLTMPPPKPLDMPWMWAGSASMTAFAGPWGVTFSPNLTPDEATGIGAWDEQLFLKVFRSGKWMGAGRPILPPMPIAMYKEFTDQDVKAIFAFLRSIPPIKNQAPDYVPPAGQPGGK
jgi:mono/diheme cytochrome c family protein